MKERISISLDKKTLKLVEETLKGEEFRNRSHIIEFILTKFLKGDEGK